MLVLFELYRGLRKEEVEARVLIPKGIATFEDLRLAMANADRSITIRNFGKSHAVQSHINGWLPSQGISTSIKEKIARHYAGPGGHVARIAVSKLAAYNIDQIYVKEHLPIDQILKPDDEEVILWRKQPGPFPAEIIIEIYRS